ncbi:MAG: response regulator [Cyclobacteriaceae bacterium]
MNFIGKIWLIDDEIFIYLTGKLFKSLEINENVEVFENGQLAISHLRDLIIKKLTLPDFIFLDIMMPVLNGWGFLDEYVQFPSKSKDRISLFILSSSISPQDVQRAKGIIEVEDYITKPLTMENLSTIIRNNSI